MVDNAMNEVVEGVRGHNFVIEAVKIFGTVLITFISSWFVFKDKNQKNKKASFDTLIQEYKELYELQAKKVALLEAKVLEISIEIRKIQEERDYFKTQLTLLQAAHSSDPFPRWLKDPSGKMIYVSDGYQLFLDKIGKNVSDYPGKTDVEIWGEETGSQFWRNDLKVLNNKKPWAGVEKHMIEDINVLKGWYFVKTPLFAPGTTVVIGIEGRAIPTMTQAVAAIQNLDKLEK